MDSLTHIVLGASVGEAFFEKGFGKKAMFWGALAQSIPDIDFIAAPWLTTSEGLLAHRGFTHSFLFAVLIIPVFALIADRIHRPHNITFYKWLAFFTIEIFVHLFIDAFNNYGIGWLEPFNHSRFSFNIIYVADPFFSIVPTVSFFMLVLLNRYNIKRKFWWKLGVFTPLIYLSYCTINKIKINADVKEIMIKEKIADNNYFTTPAPLQNWLWYIVIEKDSGYDIGFKSLFDNRKNIDFHFFSKNEILLKGYADHEELQKLKRFSKGFYTIENWHDTTVFNDLRFGQILGWNNPANHFVFHYYLKHPNDNKLIVQRGRFEDWNWKEIKIYLNRIRGI